MAGKITKEELHPLLSQKIDDFAAHEAESIYLQEEEPSAVNHKTLWFAIGSEANFDGGGVNIANAQTSTTPPETDDYWFEPIKN
ncbi:hypothetical protein [Desulfitobacterium chlororespirans]|uniref:Uncharacterized protein n=1 Tax=Desulfitobacterium chlororespirans DSM 11544 TaxID=1121395 RepID=A0A1M7T5U5_9FIRM|nr:hypothetical protein [Desulfitobacterium chlororespirans]SHN66065.1 hypothetical protein SAMN02745215_01612 [Desulfitobacterium chlororespirans DSM 11544]